jgi:hypothetical protein
MQNNGNASIVESFTNQALGEGDSFLVSSGATQGHVMSGRYHLNNKDRGKLIIQKRAKTRANANRHSVGVGLNNDINLRADTSN